MAEETRFRILHLSDFHWSPKTANDQQIIVNEMIRDLSELTRDKGVDLIIFSGDLVFSGKDPSDFERAKNMLLDRVRDACSLTDAQIIICPGNHDLNRESVALDDYLEEGLKAKLANTERLNEHVDRFLLKSLSDDAANVRLANYFDFVRQYYHTVALFKSNYVDCIKLSTPIGILGIAIFNTAWRSTGVGDSERETILLPDRVVQKARDELKECDVWLAVFHHPLEWLAQWNAQSVRTPLFTGFDLLMFGHVHDEMPSLIQNPIGNCIFAQSGCLFERPKYWNGYQLIDLGFEESLRIDMSMRTWHNRPRGAFAPAERISAGGKQTFYLRSAELGRKLQTRDLILFQNALDESAEAHLRALQTFQQVSFNDSFTCPPLSFKTEIELAQLRPKTYKESLKDLQDFLPWSGVHVLVGARESGKTTLSFKIAKDLLQTSGSPPKIPIRVDFSSLRKYDKLDSIVRRYVSGLQIDLSAKKIVESHRCVFIVDNVSMVEREKVGHLQGLIKASKEQHDWIILLDQVDMFASSTIAEGFYATEKPIYIHPFGRPEIRTLVSKIAPALASPGDVETVIKLIDDNKLPRNAYIVTLIYCALSSAASLESSINEATLLDRLIDVLLNKVNPLNVVRSSTDFGGLNLLLEEIAFWYHDLEQASMAENDLLNKLATYLTKRGILEGAARILEGFLESGVLEKRGEEVCFRYRSFQGFFLAKYAARRREFAPRLVEGLGILKFAKEFSLLCDLSRHDEELLTFLEVTVLELRPHFIEEASKSSFMDAISGSQHLETIASSTMDGLSNGPQTLSQVDEMMDFRDRAMMDIATKVETAEPQEFASKNSQPDDERAKKILQFAGFIESWRVWGRAITSLDFVELRVRKPSFLRLLDYWSRLASAGSEAGSKLLEQIFEGAERNGKVFTKELRDRMEYVARVNMPISSVQTIFSHIGSNSIHKLLIETFDEIDIHTPEALGAVCMLIKQMPEGWKSRVERYIDGQIRSQDKGLAKYFILEALSEEYTTRVLTKKQLQEVQELLAHLLAHGGFVSAKADTILNHLRQNRPKLETLIGAGTR